MLEGDRPIEELLLHLHWHTDDHHHVSLGRLLDQLAERFLRLIQKERLVKEVSTRISRDRELRGREYLYAQLLRLKDHLLDAARIVVAVSYSDVGHSGRYLDISIVHTFGYSLL